MSQRFAVPNNNLFHYLKNREIDELYFATFVKTIARSLILIFVPIYLVTIGLSIRMVAVFFLLEFLGMAIATPLGLWLNSRIGVKKTMAISDLIFVIYLLAINSVSLSSPAWYFVVPGLIFSLSGGLFWAGYHVDFTTNVDSSAEGKEFSLLQSLVVLASALGPFIGSLVIVGASFEASFVVAAFLITLGITPLFFTKDFKTPPPVFTWKRLQKADDAPKARSYLAYGLMTITNETFWPLYIFLLLRSVLDVGAVFTLTALLIIVLLIWFGRRVDRHPRKSLVTGVWLHAPSWIVRIFLVSPLGFLVSNTYGQVSYQLLDTAFEKVVYSEAKSSKDISNYFFFRELWVGIGQCLACLMVILTGNLIAVFILTSVVLFFHLGLAKRLSIRPSL